MRGVMQVEALQAEGVETKSGKVDLGTYGWFEAPVPGEMTLAAVKSESE